MALNNEIERKWLVDINKIPFELTDCKCVRMKQSYISFSPTVRLRCENDDRFILCVKTKPKKDSFSREEFECEITKSEYNTLIRKIDGIIVEKTRYFKPDGKGHTMEIDVFDADLEGLCYLEIEFSSDEEAKGYAPPNWAYTDVTSDKRFKNACLAREGKIPSINF